MIACGNCSRPLQPSWKYCIHCGTRVAAAARSRPLPKRTPVPGIATVTGQTPIVPADPPAPLSDAPAGEPVPAERPDAPGERPSLREALAAVQGPQPHVAPEPEPESEPELSLKPEDAGPEPGAARGPRFPRRASAPAGTLVAEAPAPAGELTGALAELDLHDDEHAEGRRPVNTLAILAMLIGILACPLSALFGHLALGQVRATGERGVIPAWIAVVLGYLWLAFWIVFAVTYLASNG